MHGAHPSDSEGAQDQVTVSNDLAEELVYLLFFAFFSYHLACKSA
jgi:hypothetical protein